MNIIYTCLCSLTVYRGILSAPVMESAANFYSALEDDRSSDDERIDAYCEIYHRLIGSGHADFGGCLEGYLKYDEGVYPAAVASGGGTVEIRAAAGRDINILGKLTQGCEGIKNLLLNAVSPHLRDVIDDLPEVKSGQMPSLERLEAGYRRDGCGEFARGRAFVWDGTGVLPVENLDLLTQQKMIGYQWQRQEVIKNTRMLIQGNEAANVLLHGYSGTGKSATVKSLIHIPELYNLRIIEIAKEGMPRLRRLIEVLSGKSQKFILFIDDLTFSGDEEGYSALKSVLEGGLGMRPKNVVVYATSNRRHMVRESFSERKGDDIHMEDTIQEKTSLSDRFGIRIPYMALTKTEFIKTVGEMVSLRGIEIDSELLQDSANKWEIAHGGRTPRVARQFVDYLAGGGF